MIQRNRLKKGHSLTLDFYTRPFWLHGEGWRRLGTLSESVWVSRIRGYYSELLPCSSLFAEQFCCFWEAKKVFRQTDRDRKTARYYVIYRETCGIVQSTLV